MSIKLANGLMRANEELRAMRQELQALRVQIQSLRDDMESNYARKRGPKVSENGEATRPSI
jgi:phage shock protein A